MTEQMSPSDGADVGDGGRMRRPAWRSFPGAAEGAVGWGWLALIRVALAVTLLVHVFASGDGADPSAGHRAADLTLALLPLLSAVSLAPVRLRSNRLVAAFGAGLDAAVVLGAIGLHLGNPDRTLLALVVLVQAEAGAVLGLTWAVAGWAGLGAAALALEIAARRRGADIAAAETALRLGVGLLLALGGAALSRELSGEREQRLAEREGEVRSLADREARYRALVERIPVVTYVGSVDEHGSMLYVSPQIERLTGHPPRSWVRDPKLLASLLHPDDQERVSVERERSTRTGRPFVQEYRIVTADRGEVWVRDEATLVRDADGTSRYWQGVLADVTQRRAAEEQVAYLAYHDELTGLPNRAMFRELLDLAVARARRNNAAVAVLFLDLDEFKAVNDTLGHGAGDLVLREVGGRLREAVREVDTVARRGGDEFLVLLPDLEAEGDGAVEAALSVADRIHGALEQPFPVDEREFRLGASIGASVYPDLAGDVAELLRQADAAMYRSKRRGHGGTMVYGAEPV
jgi:diguanylate cyclase (GGDEF)-like protein/PAS domain S-box-containing protein